MKKTVLLSTIALAGLGLAACGGATAPVTTTNTATNKAANTAVVTNSGAANTAAGNTAAGSTAAKTGAEPQTQLKDESAQKPKGDAKKPKTTATIPANWIDMVDEVRGYGFQVPEGTTGDSDNSNGVDMFVAKTPDDIGIIVFAFKDATLTKADLLDRAEAAMKELGTTITAGELKGESDNYAVAEASSVGGSGKKSKLNFLVGTDVSDNYVMIVGCDENKYNAKKETIDAIWGSFEMWSGGGTGR